MFHQFHAERVTVFHIRGSASEDPLAAFKVFLAVFIQRHLIDSLGDFLDVVGDVLQMSEFFHIDNVVMSGQNDSIRTAGVQFHERCHNTTFKRIINERDQLNIFRMTLEVRDFSQQFFYLVSRHFFGFCSRYAGNLNHP